jgi:hypothetical protein
VRTILYLAQVFILLYFFFLLSTLSRNSLERDIVRGSKMFVSCILLLLSGSRQSVLPPTEREKAGFAPSPQIFIPPLYFSLLPLLFLSILLCVAHADGPNKKQLLN